MTVEWNNRIAYGPASLVVKMSQDASEKRYKYSGVGTKEKRNDTVDVTLGLRVARADSVQFIYRYQWRWDNQIYQAPPRHAAVRSTTTGTSISRGCTISSNTRICAST